MKQISEQDANNVAQFLRNGLPNLPPITGYSAINLALFMENLQTIPVAEDNKEKPQGKELDNTPNVPRTLAVEKPEKSK